jgi:hypothetical protein
MKPDDAVDDEPVVTGLASELLTDVPGSVYDTPVPVPKNGLYVGYVGKVSVLVRVSVDIEAGPLEVGDEVELPVVTGEPEVLLDTGGTDDTEIVSVNVKVSVELGATEEDGRVIVIVTSVVELDGATEDPEYDPEVVDTGDPEVLLITGGTPVLMMLVDGV